MGREKKAVSEADEKAENRVRTASVPKSSHISVIGVKFLGIEPPFGFLQESSPAQ
jgi:hypothetical protein